MPSVASSIQLILRPFQEEALYLLQKGGHLLCIAPTGSGKSLVYERVAQETGRRTLLISPLIALARQQADRLRDLGIHVVLYPGTSPKPPAPQGAGVWIISPESLQSPFTLQRIRSWKPDFLVVDECHCLYDWGDQFRTAFLEIPQLISILEIPRSLWLTATLPPIAKQELENRIKIPLQVIGHFELAPNLHLRVRHLPWIHRSQILFEELSRQKGSGIIFVNTRSATHRVQNLIAAAGRVALIYHAGLSHEERCSVERRFRETSNTVLIATSAFGMGMDYWNLRWAVMWQPPSSLLALAQALGRVGRNRGIPSFATVFWDEEDFRNLEWMTHSSLRRLDAAQEVRNFLTLRHCRDQALQTYFNSPNCEDFKTGCGRCDFCLCENSTPPEISNI